jgi:hypothetical protein
MPDLRSEYPYLQLLSLKLNLNHAIAIGMGKLISVTHSMHSMHSKHSSRGVRGVSQTAIEAIAIEDIVIVHLLEYIQFLHESAVVATLRVTELSFFE